jgi:HEAT repeat protein
MPELLAGLGHPHAKVRGQCAAELDHYSDDECAIALGRLLRDSSAYVRKMAAHGIICDRCKSTPLAVDAVALLIERVLTDPSVRVRRVCIVYLGGRKDPRIEPAMRQAMASDPDATVRLRAERLVRELQQCAVAVAAPS